MEKAVAVHCCMLRYAKFKGDWNEYHNDYRWHKLAAAARHIGYRFEGNAHRALQTAGLRARVAAFGRREA